MPRRLIADHLRLAIPLRTRDIQRLKPEWADDVKANLGGLLALAKDFDEGVNSLASDSDLTETGREKSAWKLGRATLEKLDTFRKSKIAGIKAQATQLEGVIFAKAAPKRPTDPGERIAYELRQREIRDQLRGLDPVTRLTVYFGATDPEVIDAIESAPPTLTKLDGKGPQVLRPFVDPAKVATAKIERARTKAPELATELEALTALAEVYEVEVNGLKNAITEQMPALQTEVLRNAHTGDAFDENTLPRPQGAGA